jgi:uncharacterized protein YceK
MGKKSLFFIALLAVSGVVLSGCGRVAQNTDNTTDTTNNTVDNSTTNQVSDSTTNTTTNNTTTNSVIGLPTVTQALKSKLIQETQLASEQIKKLQPTAQLVLVSMKFTNSFSDISGLTNNFYIYKSSADPNYYYLVDSPRDGTKPRRFLTPTEDFEFELNLMPIPLEYWKLTYVDAINKAEAIGGAEFRTKNPNWEVTEVLGLPAGQSKLAWTVSYRALTGSNLLKVYVDANTGDARIVQ